LPCPLDKSGAHSPGIQITFSPYCMYFEKSLRGLLPFFSAISRTVGKVWRTVCVPLVLTFPPSPRVKAADNSDGYDLYDVSHQLSARAYTLPQPISRTHTTAHTFCPRFAYLGALLTIENALAGTCGVLMVLLFAGWTCPS